MRLKQLDIRNFRGIRRLNWTLPASESLICLVGPGDAGKTTVLDALELAFSPRWNPRLTETDFHGCDPASSIRITATVGGVPPELLTQHRFGLDARGWSPEAELHDEPEDDDEEVLTVRFTVDETLEPAWVVINHRLPEGKPIGARERAQLASTRLDREVERHLAWGRGSALAAVTSSTVEIDSLLADIGRKARAAANAADLPDLADAATKAQDAAKDYGAGIEGDYRPGLDSSASMVSSAAFTLHADEIPIKQAGLGSRRLVSLALQSLAVREGALVLIDEIEHGLEPHRVRHLLQLLRTQLDVDPPVGQAIATTHSAVSIEELEVRNIYVVRTTGKGTELRRARTALQATARLAPEALLARRVLVCEGKTEIGVVRRMGSKWAGDHGAPLSHVGVVPALGGGDTAARVAKDFRQLGFPTALLGDSDKPFVPPVEALQELGVRTYLWEDELAVEQRVALDLPLASLSELLSLAVQQSSEQAVRDSVHARLSTPPATTSLKPDEWVEEGIDEIEVRTAIGDTAKANGWFKRVDHGDELASLITTNWDSLDGSDLRSKLEALGAWAYGE
jgi:energy-coupling factor transporter ATP-binding protein EcfA2